MLNVFLKKSEKASIYEKIEELYYNREKYNTLAKRNVILLKDINDYFKKKGKDVVFTKNLVCQKTSKNVKTINPQKFLIKVGIDVFIECVKVIKKIIEDNAYLSKKEIEEISDISTSIIIKIEPKEKSKLVKMK